MNKPRIELDEAIRLITWMKKTHLLSMFLWESQQSQECYVRVNIKFIGDYKYTYNILILFQN